MEESVAKEEAEDEVTDRARAAALVEDIIVGSGGSWGVRDFLSSMVLVSSERVFW